MISMVSDENGVLLLECTEEITMVELELYLVERELQMGLVPSLEV